MLIFMLHRKLFAFGAALVLIASCTTEKNVEFLPKWEKGMLDIHTINTGRGNCQYIVMPDGTTMMIDAGDFDTKVYKDQYCPMTCSDSRPDDKGTAAEAIANYIGNIRSSEDDAIDYFLLTHFHSDHYGQVKAGLPTKKDAGYSLIGITELNEYIPVHTLIDRGYPDYSFPIEMIGRFDKEGNVYDPSFENYYKFVTYQTEHGKMNASSLELGSDEQIVLINTPEEYPSFSVRGIKKNNALWKGEEEGVVELFDAEKVVSKGIKVKENQMSCAIVMEYGSFRYYAGGDNSGLVDQDHESWYDMETPISEVVGRVSAMTLDHHGNMDATNLNILNNLDPRVVLMQTWSSDHPGQEVGQRLISRNVGTRERDIFMTYFCPLTSLGIGPWFEKGIDAKSGNIVLRVFPDYHYEVFVLDDTTAKPIVLDHFGPYTD